jgi:hypothetical protein
MNMANTAYSLIFHDGSLERTADGKSMVDRGAH